MKRLFSIFKYSFFHFTVLLLLLNMAFQKVISWNECFLNFELILFLPQLVYLSGYDPALSMMPSVRKKFRFRMLPIFLVFTFTLYVRLTVIEQPEDDIYKYMDGILLSEWVALTVLFTSSVAALLSYAKSFTRNISKLTTRLVRRDDFLKEIHLYSKIEPEKKYITYS